MSKRNSPERDIHRAVANHLRIRAREDVLWFHVPNAPRNAIAGAILKQMGMLAGVFDFLLFHNGESFALELKAPGGRPSIAQLEFQSRFNLSGGYAVIAEGLDEALNILNTWGLLR